MTINYKATFKQLGLIVLTIAIGTIFDWIVHHTSPRFEVPFEYYPNKIIFGSLWGFIIFKVLRNYIKVKNPTHLAFLMSLLVAITLQTKYFLQGYDLYFVILFMVLHFIMFLVPAIFIFKKYKQVLKA